MSRPTHRQNAAYNAAAGAKAHGRRGLPRAALAIALLAAGCARNTGGCGIGNGCAGGSASTLDNADSGVMTTSATLSVDPNARSGSAPTTADLGAGGADPGAPVTEQGGAVEVRVYVPAPVAAPAATTRAAAVAAQGDQGEAQPSTAMATPAVAASPVTTSSQPPMVTYADAGAAPPRPPPSASSPPTIEQWSTSGAFYGPQGYVLSEAGAGPFSNGAGGPTGFPSD